jgi:phosphoribosyl-ATP pyrophosphohydrolase/phosphoribosyl-AMP cyclohydrolase
VTQLDISTLKFDDQGLLVGVIQAPTGEVRMVGYFTRAALEKTLATGLVTFWSRSRQRLWTKGESSGHCLRLRSIHPDCDGDALLVVAEPAGPTCHRGTDTCFEGESSPATLLPWLDQLEQLLKKRKASAQLSGSYTQKLFATGLDRIAKKVTEEAGEVVIAAKNHAADPSQAHQEELLGEAADLLFHLQMVLVERGLGLQGVVQVLQARHAQSSR